VAAQSYHATRFQMFATIIGRLNEELRLNVHELSTTEKGEVCLRRDQTWIY
jgi:hypothetical protein